MWRRKKLPATHSDLELSLGIKYRRAAAISIQPLCGHVVTDAANDIRFGCCVDCEGGGINVALSRDDKSAIIRLERIRIWNRNEPDQEAEDALVAGADDNIFRFDGTAAEECAELVTNRRELAAVRHK
jgi:hypothetical protein